MPDITRNPTGICTIRLTRWEIEVMGMQPWCELNQYPHEYKTGEVNGADYVEWQVPEADLSWLMLQYGGEFEQDPYHDEPPYMPTNWTHILGK